MIPLTFALILFRSSSDRISCCTKSTTASGEDNLDTGGLPSASMFSSGIWFAP